MPAVPARRDEESGIRLPHRGAMMTMKMAEHRRPRGAKFSNMKQQQATAAAAAVQLSTVMTTRTAITTTTTTSGSGGGRRAAVRGDDDAISSLYLPPVTVFIPLQRCSSGRCTWTGDEPWRSDRSLQRRRQQTTTTTRTNNIHNK